MGVEVWEVVVRGISWLVNFGKMDQISMIVLCSSHSIFE